MEFGIAALCKEYMILKTVCIDGEWFALSIPTSGQWSSFMSYLRKNKREREQWNNLWKDSGISTIYCQSITDDGFLLNRAFVKCEEDSNNFTITLESDIDKSYSNVGFLPMMFPLNQSGTDLDLASMQMDTEFEVTKGGTFYINKYPIQLIPGKGALYLTAQQWDSFDQADIGDSHSDGTPNEYRLSWRQIHYSYLGNCCLMSDISFREIEMRFNSFLRR